MTDAVKRCWVCGEDEPPVYTVHRLVGPDAAVQIRECSGPGAGVEAHHLAIEESVREPGVRVEVWRAGPWGQTAVAVYLDGEDADPPPERRES